MQTVVVLVGTSHPGNVGAAARAAANFGASGLRFVAPRCDVRGDEALARAKHARGLLADATVHDSLDDALAGTSLAVATTARHTTADNRFLRKPVDVREWAAGLHLDGTLALVFGPEDTGLSSDHVNRCHATVTVPTADYASLNLAHAVSVVCYEVFAHQADSLTAPRTLSPDMLAALGKAWDDLVSCVEPRPWRRDVASGMFRKIVGRSQPDDHEVHNVMGVLTNALRRFDHPDYRTAKSSALVRRKGLLAARAEEE